MSLGAWIRNVETLDHWQRSRRGRDAAEIAHRAALRVLPIWLAAFGSGSFHFELKGLTVRQSFGPGSFSLLAIFRSFLSNGVSIGSRDSATLFAADLAMAAHGKDRIDRTRTMPNVANTKMAALEALNCHLLACRVNREPFALNSMAGAAVGHAFSACALTSELDPAKDSQEIWRETRLDALLIEAEGSCLGSPLWRGRIPGAVLRAEDRYLGEMLKTGGDAWDFWLRWWQGERFGQVMDPAILERVAKISNLEWELGDPVKISQLIAHIEANTKIGTALSNATTFDFSFDALARVMRMVGLDDDSIHLRDPSMVKRFLDDCEEMRDTFNDFIDYARAIGGSPNHAGICRRAAEKVCAELDRSRETSHLRARYLVKLGHELEAFSKEAAARSDLGPTLAGVLDSAVSLLRNTTRKYFGPAYTALAPLAQLSLDHVDQDQAVRLLDEMISRLNGLPVSDLISMDDDGRAVFADMVREAHDLRAVLAEASSDEFHSMIKARLAESIGGTGIAFGKFLERSSAAAGTASMATDFAIRQFRKVNDLQDIYTFISGWLKSGSG